MPLRIGAGRIGFNPRGEGDFRLPFPEQIDYFRQKLNLPTQHYDDIINEAHDRAFVVAGAAKADLLNDLRKAVDRSIAEGKSIGWFRQEFDAIVKKHGWHGWTGEDTEAGRDWRTRVIYRTNLSASYAAGRYAQLTSPAMLKNRPYWKYIHNDTVLHPRPLHLSWNGLVLRYDDPFWQTHFPPNGWGCRCRVTAVRADQYKGDKAPDDGTYEFVDRHGEVHTMPKGIDYGWDYAPGASVLGNLKDTALKKAEDLPIPLAKALETDIKQVVDKAFEPQKTAKLAAQWAVENDLVDFADYGKIDVAVANAMNRSLFDHLQEFPELRRNQKFVGTGQQQFKRWRELEIGAYINKLKDSGVSEDVAKAHAERTIKPRKVKGNAWAHSWQQPLVSGIAVNEKWGKDLAAFNGSLAMSVRSSFHPIGCDTIKSVVDHELGHQLDDLLGLDRLPEIRTLYIEALAAGISLQVSGYAGQNIKEFIAESWAEALNNENPRRFAIEVAKIIRSEYRRRFAAA
jgi:hypothetical protein